MSSFFTYHIKGRAKMMLERSNLKASGLDPLLVFTMAKVGSSSVYNSVKKASEIPAFHIHTLNEREVRDDHQLCFDCGIYPNSRSPVPFIRRDIFERNRPYKVISLFRNPIDRNLSAFFDAFRLMMGMAATDYEGTMEDLVNAFYDRFNHDYPIRWYQQQFLYGVGVNVYEHSFDTTAGYSVIEEGHCSVLLMNSAVDDTLKSSLIADFLNLPSFQLNNANIRAASKEAKLYHQFKSHISLDEAYLGRMLDNQYFEHFFSKEDKAQTLQKWLKP